MAFFAHQERIKELLAAGCPQLLIHQELQSELGRLSYSQFSALIRKYILGRKKTSGFAQKSAKPAQHTQISLEEQTLPTVFRGFVPGPKVPNLDELF